MAVSTVIYPLASTKDSRNAGENNGENGKQSTRVRLLALIKENPRITRASLSEQRGISSSNVQFHIEKLKSEGIIKRIGTPRNGHWEFPSE
ncbi:winged helix-turn-helix domain-containing protein, partial [uncultured Muribaculum sp.]|uniref:winged helix-turn-helix domain-containing protein n=2 Tax=uncultured Muribaculum sp. TaxID=1918613 RepID=UPI0033B79B0C